MSVTGFITGFISGLCIVFTLLVVWKVYKEVKRIESNRAKRIQEIFRNRFVASHTSEPLNTSRDYVATLDANLAERHASQIHYQSAGDLTLFFGTCRCGWMTTERHEDADEVSKAIDEHYAVAALAQSQTSDRIN